MVEYFSSHGAKISRLPVKSPFIHSHLPPCHLLSSDFGLRCNAVKRRGTLCDGVKQDPMPVTIEDIQYYTAIEIRKELRISRTTMWRWKNDGKIPSGRLFRGGTVVFSEEEFVAIKAFANRLEPVPAPNRDQMSLFNGSR